MTVAALKKEISRAIININDAEFLKAVFAIIHDKSNEQNFEFSDELKKILDERKKNHRQGKSKSMSLSEVRKKITSLKAG